MRRGVHGESVDKTTDKRAHGGKTLVRGDEEAPRLVRCAALHCPWGGTSRFALGQRSELVPGSTNIPARAIAPSHGLLLFTLLVTVLPLKSPSLFIKLAQPRARASLDGS